jgi:hypothetical protein
MSLKGRVGRVAYRPVSASTTGRTTAIRVVAAMERMMIAEAPQAIRSTMVMTLRAHVQCQRLGGSAAGSEPNAPMTECHD